MKLEIKKQDAVKAHEEAEPKGKVLLENLLGKETFLKPVKERIKCFDDVLTELKIERKDFEESCKTLEPDEIAYRMAKMVSKVLNEGWIPNWEDSKEYKFFPWFKMGSPSGVGFACFGYDVWYAGSSVGSRLAFKSIDLAEFAGKLFEQEIYKPLFIFQQ